MLDIIILQRDKSLGGPAIIHNKTLWHYALTNITELMGQQQVVEQLLSKAQMDKQLGSGDGSSPDADILTAAKIVLEETVQRICPWVSYHCHAMLLQCHWLLLFPTYNTCLQLQTIANHSYTDGEPFNCTRKELAILGLRLRLAIRAEEIDNRLKDLQLINRIDGCQWIKDNLLCSLPKNALDYVLKHYRTCEKITAEYISSRCT